MKFFEMSLPLCNRVRVVQFCSRFPLKHRRCVAESNSITQSTAAVPRSKNTGKIQCWFSFKNDQYSSHYSAVRRTMMVQSATIYDTVDEFILPSDIGGWLRFQKFIRVCNLGTPDDLPHLIKMRTKNTLHGQGARDGCLPVWGGQWTMFCHGSCERKF